MQREEDEEGNAPILCVNHVCASNGGDNADQLLQTMNLKPRILTPPLTPAQINAMTGVEPLIIDPTKLEPEIERRLDALFAGQPDPIDVEAIRAKLGPDDQAYFAWVKRVLKTNERLPLAKVAWDAGIEWARANPVESS